MIRKDHERRFGEALTSGRPFENLHRLATTLRDEGVPQIDVYFLFEHHQVKTAADDPLYDSIVDTMDEIHGGPWAKGGGIYSTTLTDEIIGAKRRKA